VVVGASLGGSEALALILSNLPRDFAAPIAIVQHRPPEPDATLASFLGRTSRLPVKEADDKEPIRPGCVYVAPADYHLLVEPGRFSLCTSGHVRNARPSIDLLFHTAADAYGAATVGVVLTGANDDGAAGARHLKQRGGILVVQDPSTARARTLPEAALGASECDFCVALLEVAPLICQIANPLMCENGRS
jgi:two-component system chemotaxis response regulator CheB